MPAPRESPSARLYRRADETAGGGRNNRVRPRPLMYSFLAMEKARERISSISGGGTNPPRPSSSSWAWMLLLEGEGLPGAWWEGCDGPAREEVGGEGGVDLVIPHLERPSNHASGREVQVGDLPPNLQLLPDRGASVFPPIARFPGRC